jgi:AAA+ ATPase superfamily predicted ATPase
MVGKTSLVKAAFVQNPFQRFGMFWMRWRSGRDFVIELDEVQELAAISGQLHKMLGNIFSTYRNLLFVFTGSMFGLIRTLLEPEASSPLFQGRQQGFTLNPSQRMLPWIFLGRALRSLD